MPLSPAQLATMLNSTEVMPPVVNPDYWGAPLTPVGDVIQGPWDQRRGEVMGEVGGRIPEKGPAWGGGATRTPSPSDTAQTSFDISKIPQNMLEGMRRGGMSEMDIQRGLAGNAAKQDAARAQIEAGQRQAMRGHLPELLAQTKFRKWAADAGMDPTEALMKRNAILRALREKNLPASEGMVKYWLTLNAQKGLF